MRTLSDLLMVKPIDFSHEKERPQTSRGWEMTDKLANTLVSTVVLADSDVLKKDDVVYVKANDVSNQNFVRQIYSIDGEKFILMPKSYVVLVKN